MQKMKPNGEESGGEKEGGEEKGYNSPHQRPKWPYAGGEFKPRHVIRWHDDIVILTCSI